MSDIPAAEAPAGKVIGAERRAVLDRRDLGGGALAAALAAATDRGLRALYERVGPATRGVALVAIGGYGRGELAPASDLDLLLLHDGKRDDIDEIAAALWYPLWDEGVRLGHAVRTVADQLRLAADDLDSATASLTARHLAGDAELTAHLAERARRWWVRQDRKVLDALAGRDAERHERAGEVAYLLEPDIKDGAGGLRDVHSLGWAELAGLAFAPGDRNVVEAAAARLLDVRVAMHRVSGRYGEVLRLESQDAVAEAAGAASADDLMADVAAAGREIAWVYAQTWGARRLRRERRRRRDPVGVAPSIELRDGVVELDGTADPSGDPTVVLRLAAAAARHGAPVGRPSLDRLAAELAPFGDPWPAGALGELVDVLAEGHQAIAVLESFDRAGLLGRILPEWTAVRSKPQRNAYHRYTVDRHLWEAAANAAELTDRVDRPDLLVLGALFHDIGKGYPGDHTDAGVDLITSIGPRIGLAAADVEVIARLIRHHLLLPDVAMRRDLADPATAANVAAAVGTVAELDLLHALTIADSRATGPTAWSAWKAGLVAELVERTRAALGGGGHVDADFRMFPDPETFAAMRCGEQTIRIGVDSVTTVTIDAPGTFARVAGALSLHRLDVTSAMAHSEPCGPRGAAMAAARFRFLTEPERPIEGFAGELRETIHRALAGQLAIEARLAERARAARRRRPTQAAGPGHPAVTFLEDASARATVVEVRAPTVPGLLHRLAKALADVDLDIRHATVQTIGPEAVDTFYVLTAHGATVTDQFHRAEIRRALLHAVGG